MSAFALLLASQSRNFQENNPAYETYYDRKRKWFDSLTTDEKNRLLEVVKNLCKAVNENEQEQYNCDMKRYNRMLEQWNKKSWFLKLFLKAPSKPKDLNPLICNRFWDSGWCYCWDNFGLGYPGN